MRNKIILSFAWLILLVLSPAVPLWAADDSSTTDATIVVDTTVQAKDVVDDSSKAEEYGEVPQGFLINHIQVDLSMKGDRYLEITGDRVRLNNAAYSFDYGVHEKYRLYVDYLKIPHLFSKSAVTIWNETSPGVWELPDSIQSTIENLNPVPPTDPNYASGLAAQKAFISDLLTQAHPIELGLQRNRGNAGFEGYSGTNWKYDFDYFLENRHGDRPVGTSLGFSWATELPEPIDYRTQNVRAGIEYSNAGKQFAVTYNLSLFDNNNQAIRWDNPYRLNGRTYDLPSGAYVNGDGTSLGQAQLPADNTANTINVTAGTDFGNSRVSGMFAYSRWSDSVNLLPFTVNTGITPIPLPANTFNGKMDNITVNLNYLARIGANGTFTARYRLYDLSNKSDQLFISQYVRLDQNVVDLNEENNLFAYKYNTLDLDLGWKLKEDLVWHVAYGYFRRDLDFREVNKTTTNSFKTSIDWLASEDTTVRVSYQYAQRRFDQFADDNPTYAVIPLRRYDIADVNVNTLRGEAEFSVGEKSSISINGSYGKNDYNQSVFGLQAVKEYTVGVDYSYAAGESTSLNLWYEFQDLTSDQKGRQSGAAPSTDPRADWTANLVDKYNTFGAGFSTGILSKKAVWDTDVSYAKADGAANLASPPGGAPDGALSLANANDTDLITLKTSVNWKCSDHARFIAGYEFEKYLIDDFAEDTIKADLVQYGSILLNAIQPNYLYHVGWIGMIFNW